MTQFQIAKLACRIMALWLFAEAAMALEGFVFGLGRAFFQPVSGILDLFAGTGLVTGMYGLVGALLWFGAGKIAARMSPDVAGPVESNKLTARLVMEIACSSVGLFLFVNVAASISYDIASAYRANYLGSRVSTATPDRLVSEGVRLVLALWLIFGSRGIAALIFWLRTAGDKSRPNDALEPNDGGKGV